MTMALTWPALFAEAASNVASAALMKAATCPVQAADCVTSARTHQPLGWGADPGMLGGLRAWLERAFHRMPAIDGVRLRLAEVEFALGNRKQAARLLPPVGLSLPDVQAEQTSYRSRLLMPGRYENYLLTGYQQTAAGHWDTAVIAFRLALSFGAQYMTPSDHQAYFAALAHQYAQQAEDDESPARQAYLAGKYLARAGDWNEAETWLKRAMETAGWSELTAEEQARIWMYLGLAREQAADTSAELSTSLQAARIAYQTAINLAPTMVEPQARLLALLRRLGDQSAAKKVEADLAAQGPTYKLGTFGPEYADPRPARLDNGWTLVGFDVDEESLETGGQIELWLWWQAPPGVRPASEVNGISSSARPGRGWLRIGDHWLQRQRVVNLVPNPGFEWGITENSLPLGFFHMWAPDQVVEPVISAGGPVGPTHLLHLQGRGFVSIQGPPLGMDPQALYLFSSAIRWDGERPSNRGWVTLRCSETGNFGAGIGGEPVDRATHTWYRIARLGPANPDPSTNLCRVAYFAGHGWLEWDQVMIAELPSTSLP